MKLLVLLGGERVGVVKRLTKRRLVFRYDDEWRNRSGAFPLSLSMPLAKRKYPDNVIRPFLEGLLPDNPGILERWGREFSVSPRSPFALLTHVAEDCAGAVQLVRPERLSRATTSGNEPVDWLDDSGVAARLRDAKNNAGTGRMAGDRGRFILAGEQPKTALLFDGARWGVPSGTIPTTHILKPSIDSDLDGVALNEHFCLTLARRLGLKTAQSLVREFDGERAIVLERYDRALAADGSVMRLHQEDACQALEVSPSLKYDRKGGPGPREIVDLLIRQSSDPAADVGEFIDALALNWAIAGTEAHAKNYSILLSARGVRLAPLYDIISALPYAKQLSPRKHRLAMRVGSQDKVRKIERQHWEGLAERCDLDAEPLLRRVREVLEAIPEAASRAAEDVRRDGLDHPVLGRLVKGITEHSAVCLGRLD